MCFFFQERNFQPLALSSRKIFLTQGKPQMV